MKTVCVLMSTYNGEKYLKTQIDSILAQQGVKVGLFVRDDGSTDHTLSILQQYANQCKLTYYTGANLKPARSFMDLVVNAPQADYYAFSDQDDYWLPNKLEHAISKLEALSTQQPCLYYGQETLVDADLNQLPNAAKKFCPFTTLPQAIIWNSCSGCTSVFNFKLIQLLRHYTPSHVMMHDAWVYQVCLATGALIYRDQESFIYYRQHGNNVIGGRPGFIKRIKLRLNMAVKSTGIRSKMVQELLKGYSAQMNADSLRICKKIANYKKNLKNKWVLLTDKSIRTGNKRIDRNFILKVLLGIF